MKKSRLLLGIIIGVLLSSTGAYAVTNIFSQDIEYDNFHSGLTATNVQDAIDEVYMNVQNSGGGGGSGTGETRLCKRASSLHSEMCESNICGTTGDVVTYGNLGTNGLTSGDAFDCDVNGDGIHDPINERFYYVTDTDEGIAVLVYYANVYRGKLTYSEFSTYNTITGVNIGGPLSVLEHLPTMEQWPNVNLINPIRSITNELGGNTTGAGTITEFDYQDRVARLLTYQEVEAACYDGATALTNSLGVSTNCLFLMQNSHRTTNNQINGYWLETPQSATPQEVWYINGASGNLATATLTMGQIAVRPVIEVEKSNIRY